MPDVCSTLVLLPVGPGTHLPFLFDTLETIERFMSPDHKVLLADDSAEGIGDRTKRGFPKVDVLVLRRPGDQRSRTVSGKFNETVAKCVRHAVANYEFKGLLRMDADALMCNSGADERALQLFASNPRLGQIGSYRVRCDGQPRDFKWSADHLRNEISFQVLPGRRRLAQTINLMVRPAIEHGYEMGENIIAPGSFTSRAACEKLAQFPLYGSPALRLTKLGDDHLTSLALRALGFELGDFATGDLPLAVWLKKLEWSPEEIAAKGKCIVHSVRGYKDQNEERVREQFRNLRGSG